MKGENKRTKEELASIEIVLRSFEQSVSAEEIRVALPFPIDRVTLARRLKKLAQKGIVVATGNKRSAEYQLSAIALRGDAPPPQQQSIPLSDEGKEINLLVSRPKEQRQPVGYNRDFIDRYIPNQTRYLTEVETGHLLKIGNTDGQAMPAGTYARGILNRLLIDLAWNSSRLEGNTYSLLDTKRLLDYNEATPGKPDQDRQMILNHKEAIEFLVDPAAEIGFSRFTISALHAILSNNLLADPEAPGRLRTFEVGIGKSVYTPIAIPVAIAEAFDLILGKASSIENPFEQAFFVMVHLPYLQPFDDVNKRVSRLAANIPLIKSNLAPLSFIDVPERLYINGILGIYELNRIELLKDVFIWAYERSARQYSVVRQTVGEPDPFRLKYHVELRMVISEIISGALNYKPASDLIAEHAKALPEADRKQFIAMVERELLSIHEGNFARYRVTPLQYKLWKNVWEKK